MQIMQIIRPLRRMVLASKQVGVCPLPCLSICQAYIEGEDVASNPYHGYPNRT